jgi:glyoxylase-like metal-dependent hydrolase (beta-lactamase superfamily II)
MEVVEGVHRLTHGITNFYLIEQGEKLILVDAGTPKDWAVFLASVTRLGYELSDLEAILLTHAHADHTGFAEKARTTAKAGVWIHEDDEHSLTTGQVSTPDGKLRAYLLKPQMYKTMISLGSRGASRIAPVLEVSSFSDGEVLDVPGKPRVIHAPGHTAGSCALLLEDSHTLFAGDVLTTWNPLTGASGPQIMPSGMNHDTEQAIRSLGAFDGISAETVLPGHGEPWTGGLSEAVRLARGAGSS